MSFSRQDLEKAVQRLREENARKDQEIELLRQKVDLLARKVFGSSSEKANLDQLLLFDGDKVKKLAGGGHGPEDNEPSPEKQSTLTKKRPRRQREATLPADLPIEETVLVPREVEQAPEAYRQVSEEVTVKLDFQPAQFKKLITRRPKFVKRLRLLDEPARFYLAPLPPSLKERSLLTPRLAATIASNRFCNHQPYYRQEQHFQLHHQVHLPRNTQSQWMRELAENYLAGIYRAMHGEMLHSDYLQADETPIDYLKPGQGRAKQGYLWTLSRPDLDTTSGRGDILYQWHPTRAAKALDELLTNRSGSFQGTLQCDGYQAYEVYAREHPEEVELIGCWAHVRRKFYEARQQKPKVSGWILGQMGHLYRIEEELRQGRASPSERERVRRLESLPIYQRLGKALWKLRTSSKILPQSSLGKAIDYALGQWPKLEKCFRSGILEIDNNLIENGIRPTKLGAKNWLFMGSEEAGQTNAIWYTLIESCRRRQVDPWRYLVWIFEELPQVKVTAQTFPSYTPKAFAKKLAADSRRPDRQAS